MTTTIQTAIKSTLTAIERREVSPGRYSYTMVFSSGTRREYYKNSKRLYDVAQVYHHVPEKDEETGSPITFGKSIQYPQYWRHIRTVEIVAV